MERRKLHAAKLRKGRVSIPGQVYLVTTVTKRRRPLFLSFERARMLVGVLRECEQNQLAHTLAFVVMPDHLHWLMCLEEKRTLSSVVGAVKSISARRFGGGRRWQPGFHDHALRKEEDLVSLARYVVANPLRAGLVSRLGDYPHWDAIWL